MLRIVMVLAVWLAIYPTDQEKPSRHPNEPSQYQSKEHTSRGADGQQGDTPNNATNDCAAHSQEKRRDWLETAYFYSGPLACLLSLVTAFVIWLQIGSHAKAERPWVLLSIADESSERNDGDQEFFPLAYWKVKNFGKTPALIDSITGAVTVVESLENLPKLIFTTPNEFAFEPVIAPQQESSFVSFKMKQGLTKESTNDLIEGNGIHLVMAGRVEYRDTFGNKHFSNFCYSFTFGHPDERGFNRMCGPESYNQYT
jgi:hypothetical protein